MDNYKDKSLMEKVAITNENSGKWYLKREISIIWVMLSDSQTRYQKLILRSYTSKKRNQKKRIKHQRTERYDIKGVVTKEKL